MMMIKKRFDKIRRVEVGSPSFVDILAIHNPLGLCSEHVDSFVDCKNLLLR